MKHSLRAAALTALLLHGGVTLSAASEGAMSAPDAAVQQALRSALLGDAAAVRALALERRVGEKAQPPPPPERHAENLAALGVATERPLPPSRPARGMLEGFRRDAGTRGVLRLLQTIEPRQRFREARLDRRYEQIRRTINGVFLPVFSALRGELFALISLPFEAAERLVVGGRYVTPEQRRELYTARAAAPAARTDAERKSPERALENYTPRRLRLAALQAEVNGRRAREQGQEGAALFWFDREVTLRQAERPLHGAHRALLTALSRIASQERSSVTVADGDALARSAEEFADATDLLRSALLAPGSEVFRSASERFAAAHPQSAWNDDAQAFQAALVQREGRFEEAVGTLQQIAARRESPWAVRAAAYLKTPELGPAATLRHERAREAARLRDYLLEAKDPWAERRGLTPEEARQRRGLWVDRARVLFITDSLARLLFLPFADSRPRDGFLDAAGRVDPKWYESEEGRRWLRRVASAQREEKRYRSAGESYRRAGDVPRAEKMERKAARALERLARETTDPRLRVTILERRLTAYPNASRRERVEKDLSNARAEAEASVVLTREELRAYPELWRDAGLRLPATVLDGKKSNGEVSREGIAVLRRGAASYVDRATGNRIELPVEEKDRVQVEQQVLPRRTANQNAAELRKPLPRKRIPAALEAGAFPGFDASPTLVPLAPDPRDRRLYE